MKLIKRNSAITIMIGILSLVLIFHFSVLFEIIPYTIVWAGKINSIDEMRVFEVISILINSLLIVVLIAKKKNIRNQVTNNIVNLFIWIFVFLFAINTIGNLFATSLIELILGTSLTFISSLLCWIIVRNNSDINTFILDK